MKLEFRRDPQAKEMRVVIIARERDAAVEAVMRRIAGGEPIRAYCDREEVLLRQEEVVRIYTEKRRVLAESSRGTFVLRERLYELEERLGDREFVRISNSEIVNRRRIESLDYSLTGTIRLRLEGGNETYVSRRYVSRIKKIFES